MEFEWICILGTKVLLRETRNIDTLKFKIRGVKKLNDKKKFKTGLQNNFDLTEIFSKPSLT